MEQNPFFTIIIPTLNEEKLLPRLLSDLRKQKVKNFEVIIVDGCSQDKTKDITTDFKKYLSLKFIEAKKPNVSNQKNIGAEAASGRYLIFLDADMHISTAFTASAERQIKRKRGLIFIPYVYPNEKKEYPDVSAIFLVLNKLVELSQNLNKPFSGGPSIIFEKNTFRMIDGFDNIFGEDHYIVRKAYKWGIKTKILPSLKVQFSLRRMKREGRLKLFYHFAAAHISLLFKDQLNQKIFKYKMGGHLDKDIHKPGNQDQLEKLLGRVNGFFRVFLQEE